MSQPGRGGGGRLCKCRGHKPLRESKGLLSVKNVTDTHIYLFMNLQYTRRKRLTTFCKNVAKKFV